jgi:S1-C subfamily serine protease
MLLSSPKEQDPGIQFEATEEGLRILSVAPESPAAKIGLEPGDVILSVYGHPVTSRATWEWLTASKNDYTELRVRDVRRGVVLTRYVNLG